MSKLFKTLSLLLTVGALGLSACGGGGGEDPSSSAPSSSQRPSSEVPSSSSSRESSTIPSSEAPSSQVPSSTYIPSSEAPSSSSHYVPSSSSQVQPCQHSVESRSDDTYHWQECTKCGATFDKEEHIWDVYGQTSPDEDGNYVTTYICNECGRTKDEYGHQHVVDYSHYVSIGEEGHAYIYSCGHEGYDQDSLCAHELYIDSFDGEGNVIRKCYSCDYEIKEPGKVLPESNLLYTVKDDGNAYIIGSVDSEAEPSQVLKIPSKIEGHDVAGIDDNPSFSFNDIYSIRSIIFEEGITYIGKGALPFEEVKGEVKFPESLKECHSSVGSNDNASLKYYFGKNLEVLEGIYSADEITFTSTDLKSGNATLVGNKIVFEEGVKYIPDSFDINRYTYVELPDSLLNINKSLTKSNLDKNFTIEDGIYYLKTPSNPYFAAVKLMYSDERSIAPTTKYMTYNVLYEGIINSHLSDVLLPDNVTFIDIDHDNLPSYFYFNVDEFNYDDVGGGYYIGSSSNPYMMLVSINDYLSEITVHDDCKYIVAPSFDGYEGSINLNEGVKEIAPYAFKDATILNDNFVIPDSVTTLNVDAFYNVRFNNVKLGEGLVNLDDCFSRSNASNITFGKNVRTLHGSAIPCVNNLVVPDYITSFTYIGGFLSLTLPKSIESYSFGGTIYKLTYLGDSVEEFMAKNTNEGNGAINELVINGESIDEYHLKDDEAFISLRNYYFIKKLYIPASISTWGPDIFTSNNEYEEVHYAGGLKTFLSNDGSPAPCQHPWKLYLGEDDQELEEVDIVKDYPVVEEYSDKYIAINDHLSYCSSIKRVILGNTDLPIRNYSMIPFRGCKGISELEIEDGVTSIPASLMRDSSVSKVNLPSSITKIGSNAFSGCKDLELALSFDHEVTIGNYAFDSTGVTSLRMTSGTIGEGAFANAKNLGRVTLEKDVTSVGYHAFSNNPEILLTSIKTEDDYAQYDSNWYVNDAPALTYYIGLYSDFAGEYVINTSTSWSTKTDGKYHATYMFTRVDEKSQPKAYLYSFSTYNGQHYNDPITIDLCYTRALHSLGYIEGFGVYGILPGAFKNAQNVKEVVIDSRIKNIGYGALSGLANLEKLTIEGKTFGASTVTSTSNYNPNTFYRLFDNVEKNGYYHASYTNSDNVKYEAYIPASLYYFASNIAEYGQCAFAGVTSLQAINFLSIENITVTNTSFVNTNIRDIAYEYSTSNIASLRIGYAYSPFYDLSKNAETCRNDEEEVSKYYVSGDFIYKLNDEEKTAKLCTHTGDKSVTELYLPSSISVKGSTYLVSGVATNAIVGLPNLVNLYVPGTIGTFDNNAVNNSSLYRLVVYSEASDISFAKSSFANTKLLEVVYDGSFSFSVPYVVIPNLSETRIVFHEDGYVSFNNVLTEIPDTDDLVIPEGVTSLNSLDMLNGKKSVNFPDSFMMHTLDAYSLDSYVYNMDQTEDNGVIYLGCEDKPYQILYKVTEDFSSSTYTVKEGCRIIACWAFNECESLEHIDFASTLEVISRYAFRNSGLTDLDLGGNLYYVGSEAFFGVTGLTELTIPDNITYLGDDVFANCYNIASLTIGEYFSTHNYPLGVLFGTYDDELDLDYLTEVKQTIYSGSATYNSTYYFPTVLTSVTFTGSTVVRGMFSGCSTITDLNITKATTVLKGAFRECTGLTSYELPETVTFVGEGAFYGCSNLVTLVIPSSVETMESTFSNNDGLLEGCDSLENLTLPFLGRVNDDDTNYATVSYMFSANTYLNTGRVPTSLTTLTITKAKTIDLYAFYDCPGLTTVNLPESLEQYNLYNYGDEYAPNIAFTEYEGAYYLGNEANPYMVLAKGISKDASTVTIHEDTKIIARNAFNGFTNFDTLIIPEGVVSICDYAFEDCDKLLKSGSLVLPTSLRYVGSWAFNYDWIGHANLYYDGDLADWCNIYFVDGHANPLDEAAHFYILDSEGSVEYNGKKYSEVTEIIIPEGVTSVGQYQFYHTWKTIKFTSISIPSSVTKIGNNAFQGLAPTLTSITFAPNSSLVEIGDEAFSRVYYSSDDSYANKTITSIEIPEGVVVIGESAFNGFNALTSVTIPSSVEVISRDSFSGSTAIYNTYDNAYYLGNIVNPYHALIRRTSTSITECEIHEDTKVIAASAFSGCSSLTELVIPAGVTNIGDCALYSCDNITTLTLPFIGNDVTSDRPLYELFDNNTHYYDAHVETITLLDGATTLYYKVFEDENALKTIYLPSSITKIESYIFYGLSWSAEYSVTVYYDGNVEDFEKIDKGNYWYADGYGGSTIVASVVCNDDTIEL